MSAMPVVMILGNTEQAEMVPLVEWLDRIVSAKPTWIIAATVEQAISDSYGERFPDMIVVLQSWPNEFSLREVNELLLFAPLARIVVCYGSWCESDGRNHSLWPQSVRVPLWAAQSRIEREWGLIRNPGSRQPIPWSASREEVFAADHSPIRVTAEAIPFDVDSPDSAYRQSVVGIMAAAGHRQSIDQPKYVLFDADPWGQFRAAALQSVRAQFPNATVVALLSLPLPAIVAELQARGVNEVYPKLGFRGLR